MEPSGSARRVALRRLRRDRAALASGALLLLLVGSCVAAPLWARQIARTTPIANHITDTVIVDGERRDVVSLDGIPIGPTWGSRFFLGADGNGRDVMVRLLYGGRNSLLIGFGAAFATVLCALLLGLVAGYFGGLLDAVIARGLDVLWSFPAILLGVALGVALALGGLELGPLVIEGGSLLIPVLVLSVIGIPYLARPIRGQVLALREQEFVDAARLQGQSALGIMRSELLPHLTSTVVVFLPLVVGNAILLEAALSFLGAGVQPPRPSWGNMIGEGVELVTSAPHLAIVPGLMLVLTVISLNVLADAVRDAFDTRVSLRLEH